MSLVWVTGVSGTGKSTLVRTLRARGLSADDADEGFCQWIDTRTGEVLHPAALAQHGWADHIDWVLSPERVAARAEASVGVTTFLCGTVSNEAAVWDLFDVVVALIADDDIVRARLRDRTGDEFGARPHELDAVLRWNSVAARTYERFGAILVDASLPPEQVADQVVAAAFAP